MEKIIVDAIGDSCPIPVVKTTKALQERKHNETVEVHVDNEIAVQNVLRMAENKGVSVKSEKVGESHFVVTLTGETDEQDQPIVCMPDARGSTVVAIGSATMGSGNEELGKILMKGFIYALSQQEKLPKTILFYNGGANIPIEGSISLEDLKSMEAQGVEILTCGTCLDFYGLKDKLSVGGVTNMYDIVERMESARTIIRP